MEGVQLLGRQAGVDLNERVIPGERSPAHGESAGESFIRLTFIELGGVQGASRFRDGTIGDRGDQRFTGRKVHIDRRSDDAGATRDVRHRRVGIGTQRIGGGFVMMLAAAAVLFGSFLLSSLYLQDVLGADALETGLAFIPFAVVTAGGVHLGTHVITRHGVRAPLAGGFALTAAGMFLLSGADAGGSYVTDILPGMLISAMGIGVVLVAVAFSVLSGAREEEAGMLSGLNTTGHELGGSLGLAVLTAIATGSASSHASTVAVANGIANAFFAAAIIAAVAAVAATVILPKATTFLPRLALARPASIH